METASPVAKPKLLVLELWGVGDLALATPFLKAATERFDVTLVAKPHAVELQRRFWPEIRLIPFSTPWTAFRGKYNLWRWPWKEFLRLRKRLRGENFESGLSARRDPRDHVLLKFIGVKRRLGFPRLNSQIFLTESLAAPKPPAYRYEYWRVAGRSLGIEMPTREQMIVPRSGRKLVLVHSGAAQAVRVWPLENYRELVRRLRENNHLVQVGCDVEQRQWWLQAGEASVATPTTISELLKLTDGAAAFIGNDSGPGHLAALCGVPTFTIFGSQVPELFLPLHPAAEWVSGKPCPYKPCSDYCHFSTPRCIQEITLEEIWPRMKSFVASHL